MSTCSLEDIDKLYYKAIGDAKLDELAGGDPGPSDYSRQDFCLWARKVIFTLGEGSADFALKKHEEIVKEFGEYRQTLTEKLSKLFTCDGVSLPGQLKDIGSCWDGSKVGAVNEMDSLYVIQGHNFLIREQEGKQGLYHVFLKNGSTVHEIKPRTIRDELTQKYSQLLYELKRPDCLEYGGYRTSGSNQQGCEHSNNSYSGVRYNGPAVTSQFLAKAKIFFTWDATPAIVLPMDAQTRDVLRQSMQAIIADNPDKMFPPSDVHLIPDVVQNVWRRSTAQMEADTLRVLSREGQMKQCLSFCKVLSSQLKAWNDKVKTGHSGFTSHVDIVKEILELMESGALKTRQDKENFDRVMMFAHIWIPSEKKEQYNEDTKSEISINNAAMKHIMFKAASKRKGAFGSKENMNMVRELMQEVFETL